MKKGDFVRARVKSSTNGSVIEDLERLIPVGFGFVHKAIDESLIKHGVGDSYSLDLSVKEAYGSRQRSLIKMINARFFRESQLNPVKGLMVNVDGLLGKVVSVSPGRVLVDFNHPLAGKPVKFEVKVLGLVTDDVVRVKALLKLMLGQDFVVERVGKELIVKDFNFPEEVRVKVGVELNKVLGKTVARSIKYLSVEGN